jgi:choline dehydrogenase-like flavoprotein
MAAPAFDAIVVGSGITGGWAAKELCEAGLNVLMLERGRDVEHGRDYVTEHAPPWAMKFRGEGNPRLRQQRNPIPNRVVDISEFAEHFFVDQVDAPYQSGTDPPFVWTRAHQVGGRSLVWGRHVPRWSALDFEANRIDGHGVDWPIRYRDLAPWYGHVEAFIGVSGEVRDHPQAPSGRFLPPMPLNCVEQHFRERVEAAFADRIVMIGPAAVLTRPHRGRAACHYCGPCERGCSAGAYFSTQSSTLPAARQTGNLTLLANQLVERLRYDSEAGRVTGVEAIDTTSGARTFHTGRVVFLCASALASAQVLLNSASERFPAGLANSSGALGHYLMDHAYTLSALARFPGFEDSYYYGERPIQFLVPRFRNTDGRSGDFLRGYNFQGRAWRSGWRRGISMPGFGSAFKHALRRPGPWLLMLVGGAECLPRYENSVSLDAHHRDKWGIPQLRIHMSWSANEVKLLEDAKTEAAAMIAAAGGEVLSASAQPMPPGSAVHEMGTARMGRDPATSVLNGYNQCHDVANVFVTDGACMASSACNNPSLTYMALTARACRYAIEQVRSGAL